MSKIYGAICRAAGKTGVYFTLIIFLFSSLMKMTSGGKEFNLKSEFLVYALIFSFVLALDDFILGIKKLPVLAAKILIHYIIAAADFILVLCVIPRVSSSGRQTVLLTVVFTAVYAVVITVFCVLRHFIQKKNNSEKDYTSKFSGQDDN